MSSQYIDAGFGKVDITPRVGVELCGYGPYLNRHSDRVLDNLYARAMAVRNGENRWVLVSCDLIALSEKLVKQIREIVSKATNWQEHEVMVHATHTHSAPCPIPDLTGWGDPDSFYMELLPRHIATACIQAIESLAPAEFFHAEVDATGFAYNRELPDPGRSNQLVLEGKWTTDKPEETDTTAHVLRVERQGRIVGFLSYFSCHPVVAGERNREIHGDFVGMATNIAEKHHDGAIGIFLQGALGDINSNFVHGQKEETLLALDDFSNRFSRVILNGIKSGKPVDVTDVRAWAGETACRQAPLDEVKLREEMVVRQDHLNQLETSSNDWLGRMNIIWKHAAKRILSEPYKDKVVVPVQCFTLGPISFTGLPLELMHRIKRRFQAEQGSKALLLSVTNGFFGYAPLREHYARPSYPAYQVPFMLGRLSFTADIEDELVDAALRANREVRK